jgi:hypothetical protein
VNGPIRGDVYVHIPSGDRFRYLGVAALAGWVVLRRISDPADADFYVVCDHLFSATFASADDLLAVAEAIGVAAPQEDQAGRQPLSEFTDGPTGPQWTDENLAEAFGLDQAAGGAA